MTCELENPSLLPPDRIVRAASGREVLIGAWYVFGNALVKRVTAFDRRDTRL